MARGAVTSPVGCGRWCVSHHLHEIRDLRVSSFCQNPLAHTASGCRGDGVRNVRCRAPGALALWHRAFALSVRRGAGRLWMLCDLSTNWQYTFYMRVCVCGYTQPNSTVHPQMARFVSHSDIRPFARYIWVRKIGRLRGSRTRGCANAAPAAMPPPTEAREGCSGLVGDACARQLDGGVDGRRPPYRRR